MSYNQRLGFLRIERIVKNIKEYNLHLASLAKWLILGSASGVLAGLGSTLFLIWLDWATRTQYNNPGLLWFLPLAGFLIGMIQNRFGALAKLGTNLIFEEIQCPARKVPLRMAPLVLVGTVVTHLFGGSAGREGTAVQIAGSLTDTMSRLFRLSVENRRIILNASIAGGFGAVFGTPLAGTVFALEVLRVGRPTYGALLPALAAAFVGDKVTSMFVTHTHYTIPLVPEFEAGLILKVLLAGLMFGLSALTFSKLTHGLRGLFERMVDYPPLRMAVGGVIIVAISALVDTRDYNGLGIPIIVEAVSGSKLFIGAFLLKILFTSTTVASGFQGGEVTPLFFIGATLGNALGQIMDISPSFMATLGFVSVFSGAANTPIACILMGIELFGAEIGPYFGITCVIAYASSGHRGIYYSQFVHAHKIEPTGVTSSCSLEEIRVVERIQIEKSDN